MPSYKRQMNKPAFGLYDGSVLVATVRANDKEDATKIFNAYGYGASGYGREVKPIK